MKLSMRTHAERHVALVSRHALPRDSEIYDTQGHICRST
jgi:hypothetical protein